MNYNQQYLNTQMYGVQSSNEYTDLNQSLGEEMRQKYPYSVQSTQTPIQNFSLNQTPVYQNGPPINMPPTNTGMMNAPPLYTTNAPPIGVPPTYHNGPQTNMPPTNMPPTNMPPTNMPPIGGYVSQTNPYQKSSTPAVMSDNFQNIHIQNSFAVHNTQQQISKNPSSDNNLKVFSNSNDIYDDGLIPKSNSNDSNVNAVFLNSVRASSSYDVHDSNNAQAFFGSPTEQGARSFFGSADKEEVFPAKVVKPRSLVTKVKADEKAITAPPVFPSIKNSETVQETTNINHPDIAIYQQQQQQQYQHQEFQDPHHHHFQKQQEFQDHPPYHGDVLHHSQQPTLPPPQQQQFQELPPNHQLQHQQNFDKINQIQSFPPPQVENSYVPVSEPVTVFPISSKFLNESFTSPDRQNISDVSFSNPQTPINTSAMSPMTPGSQTRFIESKFLNLNTLIESRRAELEALKKRNQASYSVVTGSSIQKSIISEDHHNTKQLDSDVKMWSSKYKDEKIKSEELEVKLKDLTKHVDDFNQRIQLMQSIESNNNLYMQEEIKMWSAKYEEEKKHSEEEKKRSDMLELQLKAMSDQFDEHDKKFQTLSAIGTDSIQNELAVELEQQVEELTNERDDLQDEVDTLRSQLMVQTARIRELNSNEFITKLQNEIDQLKQSLVAANNKLQSIPENVEDIMNENSELRGRLEMSEEARKKLEMLEGLRSPNNSQAILADANTNTNADTITNTSTYEVASNWEQEKEELMKQWTMQANEWTTMREAMQIDVTRWYEFGMHWESESSKLKVIAEEKEIELNTYKKELDHLKEQNLVSVSKLSSNINQEDFNAKIKELEMNMAQKWVGLLVRRKKSFLLRRSFDIMRQKIADKSSGLVQPAKENVPNMAGNDPSNGMGPPISKMYPNTPPSQELRYRGKNLTAEEEKQLQSDFDLIKQLQGNDKVIVTGKQDNIYSLISSIFYKIIIWLLLIIIAFLYIKSCRIASSSSRPVRLTS